MAASREPALTVLIANHNTARFLEVSLRALHELTQSAFEVLVTDDGSDSADLELLAELERGYDALTVFHRPPDPRGGSWAHGSALDFMTERVESPYTAVLDADCTPLMKHWDAYMIGKLDATTKIVGSSLGEGWSGHKPTDFPLPFMALFETATYRRLGISAMPEDPETGRDSCWQWRPKYLAAGYRGEILRSENTRYRAEPRFGKVNCGIYYADDGRIVGSHFGRGSNPIGKRSNWPVAIDTALRRFGGGYLVKRSLLAQQREWRRICLQIVDQQATDGTCAA